MADATACKHNHGFRFLRCDAADRLPGVWTCVLLCEFSLNFNPETYPDGIAYLHLPRDGNKKLPALSTGGKY